MDPTATAGLVGPPIPLRSLPSLALVVALALGAGVSLWVRRIRSSRSSRGRRGLDPRAAVATMPTKRVVWLTTSATIGVLFGTPLAGPLAFVELAGRRPKGELWENMFAPLVAAARAPRRCSSSIARCSSSTSPSTARPPSGTS
ncbi:hypothetical protein GS493_11950 [Rhodococcus hoagii]|nr:hypothetical protein [Prescottella equi]